MVGSKISLLGSQVGIFFSRERYVRLYPKLNACIYCKRGSRVVTDSDGDVRIVLGI